MNMNRKLFGIGSLAVILYGTSKIPNETIVNNDVLVHFTAGATIGIATDNPVTQVAAILGWEVIEPYIYKIKYPENSISVSAIDTMKDIIVGALGIVTGNYLYHEITGDKVEKSTLI